MMFRSLLILLYVVVPFYATATDTAKPPVETEAAAPHIRNALTLIENEIRVWGQRENVLTAVREHNTRTGDMTLSEIKSLNTLWQSELKKTHKNIITRVVKNPLSDYLRLVLEQSNELYTEIVVLDAQGLAVAMTDVSDSYSYVDQPFWGKTLGMNSSMPYAGAIVFSDNTMLFQAAAALPLIEDERIIGLVYAGLDTDILDERY